MREALARASRAPRCGRPRARGRRPPPRTGARRWPAACRARRRPRGTDRAAADHGRAAAVAARRIRRRRPCRPGRRVTSSSRTPSSSAATCAIVVSWPWPFDCRPGGERDRAVGLHRDADRVEVVEAGEALGGGDRAGPGALLDERAEADAEEAPLRAQLALPVAQLVVAEQLARRGGSTRRSCRRRSCSPSRSGSGLAVRDGSCAAAARRGRCRARGPRRRSAPRAPSGRASSRRRGRRSTGTCS